VDELRSYTPSWRERLSRLLSSVGGFKDETRFSADMGNKLASLAEAIPFVGGATYGNDAARSAERGDYLGAAGNAAMAGLSMVPMVKFDKLRALVGRSPYEAIPGHPSTFKLPSGEVMDAKPIPAIVDAASDYAKSRGMSHMVPDSYPALDKDKALSIAHWFDEVPDGVRNPETVASYSKLADETLGQYDALTDRGLSFSFMKKGPDGTVIDPYAKSPAMGYKDLAERGRLEILPTEAAHGSGGAWPDNPLLKPSGRYFDDGKPALYNDLLRAVHDAYGHFGYGNSFFRAPGEERAWNIHTLMYSPEARGALATETRAQNSWLNTHPKVAQQNATASSADTIYAPQKAVKSPDWVAQPTFSTRDANRYIPAFETVGPAPAPTIAGFEEEY